MIFLLLLLISGCASESVNYVKSDYTYSEKPSQIVQVIDGFSLTRYEPNSKWSVSASKAEIDSNNRIWLEGPVEVKWEDRHE